MATKRLEYIDALRGFTMILVVFAHIIKNVYGINHLLKILSKRNFLFK